MVARWVHVCVLGRYGFRRTHSTSDADTRPRPTTGFGLSRHANFVAMLLV